MSFSLFFSPLLLCFQCLGPQFNFFLLSRTRDLPETRFRISKWRSGLGNRPLQRPSPYHIILYCNQSWWIIWCDQH